MNPRLLSGLLSGLLIALLCVSCGAGAAPPPAAEAVALATSDVAVSAETETREILLGQAHGDPVMWDLARWREPLSQLYAKRGYAPLWVQPIGLTGAGQQLISELADAERRGLLTTDYDAAGLAQRVREMHDSGSATVASTMRVDLALSVAAARLASDLHDGRVRPADVGYDLDIPHPLFDAAQAVESLAASSNLGAALDAMEPQLRHYTLLKAALGKYRELDATSSALTALPPPPRFPVRAEDSYDGAPPLRRLLAALGDLRDSHDPGNSGRPGEPSAMPAVQSANDETRLDPSLVEGLKQFQLRHGLDADGILGRSTFRALTTPFATRIWQIELSLERVRWLPARLDSPPIIVNIPQFRLFAFRTTQDLAQDILQMNVIVGAAFKARQTPVFAAEMRYVVLQPYWDVPRSILVKELLPDIRARPGYLEKNGYEIVRGQSDSARPLPATPENVQLLAQGSLRLRQKPGPNNALGRVKFMFPNRHNVYLHDTPARSLFSLSSRAFSHGCIRVSDPMALLAHVMRNEPGWSEQKRDLALLGTTPVRWQLSKPIPVYIVYGTALATEAGAVMFFDDIYAQDAPLIARLTHRAG